MTKRIAVQAGDRYGRLVLVAEAPKRSGKRAWECRCDCGNTVVVILNNLRVGNKGLPSQGTFSCGCLRRSQNGESRQPWRANPYRCWVEMRFRCEHDPKYAHVEVVPEWEDYPTFRDWAYANGWEPGLTIDRVDPRGHYAPGNCRWITLAENGGRTTRGKHRAGLRGRVID
jgi:hypothetical protein